MAFRPRKTVVVPVDFETPPSVIDAARELVESNESLHVLHVLPHLSAMEPEVVWNTLTDDARIENARRVLLERRGKGLEGATFAVRIGEPGHEVARYCREIGAELVVVGSHGRHGVPRALLGSVAERIVRFAHCPVLVVKLHSKSEEEP